MPSQSFGPPSRSSDKRKTSRDRACRAYWPARASDHIFRSSRFPLDVANTRGVRHPVAARTCVTAKIAALHSSNMFRRTRRTWMDFTVLLRSGHTRQSLAPLSPRVDRKKLRPSSEFPAIKRLESLTQLSRPAKLVSIWLRDRFGRSR